MKLQFDPATSSSNFVPFALLPSAKRRILFARIALLSAGRLQCVDEPVRQCVCHSGSLVSFGPFGCESVRK